MKTIFKYILFLFVCGFFSLNYINVSAKTLKDLRSELAEMKEKKDTNQQEQALTKKQINDVNKETARINNQIRDIENTMRSLNDEIIELNALAEEKDAEIKKIMKFLQLSDGTSAYLEYIFGAKDLSDFVYRVAISEQLVGYNDKLIKEYEETIEKNNVKKSELSATQDECVKKQKELEVQLRKLGSSLNSMVDVSASIDTEIASIEKMINYYANTLQCKEDQDVNTCGKIPFSGRMIRPVASGYISSSYGDRCYYLDGERVCGFHYGTDMTGGSTNVYAVAPGVVSTVWYREPCGGNVIFIHHNINGSYYTSYYAHLRAINVSMGDYVDQNTIIGVMGGDPSVEWWDSCSTGRHLHLGLANGLFGIDYMYVSGFLARSIDPTAMINFPRPGYWFSNRTTLY